MGKYNAKGELIPDPTPVEVPVGFGAPESLESMIARLVRVESIRAAETGSAETFEESDDMDIEEDDPIASTYEVRDMVPEKPEESKFVEPPVQTRSMPKEFAKDWEEYQAFKAFREAQEKAKAANNPPESGGTQ